MSSTELSGGPQSDEVLAARQAALSDAVDDIIGKIDANSPDDAVAAANRAIESSANTIRGIAAQRIVACVVGASSNAIGTVADLHEVSTMRTEASMELRQLPPSNGVTLTLGCIYIVAALTAFYTELRLTDSLTYLLGYRSDDPVARAMGAAFAASLLVFEIVFVRLKFMNDPSRQFRNAEAAVVAPNEKAPTRAAIFRKMRGVPLVLLLVGMALLQGVTIMKMAPTREIAGDLQRNPQDELTLQEEDAVRDSVLYFSLCILISGGFLAAAGTQAVLTHHRRQKLGGRIRELEHRRQELSSQFHSERKPTLAAALLAAGLPHSWLNDVSVEAFEEKIATAAVAVDKDRTVEETARNASDVFAAEKMINLARAKQRVREPFRQKSTLALVDELLGTSEG